MDQGFKHFSHPHSLLIHHMPEGAEVSCYGCNSNARNTVYVCWQCNFFLHEQCYRATRSLRHPSHPTHPLTLLPYPTYPSNSFYCNSCEIIGTGFSYSCADCDFDLHVQCAHSISRATSFQKTHQYPTSYYTPDHQEVVPPSSAWNGQNSSMAHNNLPNPAQNPYMPPNAQYHSTGQDLAYASMDPIHSQYPISNAQFPSMTQSGHPDSIPAGLQNPPNPVTGTQDPSMPPKRPSATIHPTNPQNPSTGVQYPSLSEYTSSGSIPSNNQGPMASAQNPNLAQNVSSFSVPTASPYNQHESHVESAKIEVKDKGITHFSHPHNLFIVNLQKEENEIICSGCEENIAGKGYSCVEQNCNFHLHESCFHLKREIQHKSHPQHPLTLSLAPYNNKNGEFTCNACFSEGTGFTYHCSICSFDLHVQCVSLPETVKRKDHEHDLKLVYSCPVQGEEYRVSCNVCHGVIEKDRWMYFCGSCDYSTHLGCVDCEECEAEISVIDAQVQLQRLQLQMEMARQQAQMIASMGSSLASLV